MFNLSRHQTRSLFVQNHVRLLQRFIPRSNVIKYSSTITRCIPVYTRNLVSRFFHSSSINYNNCEFAGPCACFGCMTEQRTRICEVCGLHPTAYQDFKEDSRAQENIRSCDLVSFCQRCWQKDRIARGERHEKEKQILALYRARVASMLDGVRQTSSSIRVPSYYATGEALMAIKPGLSFQPWRRIARLVYEVQERRSTRQGSSGKTLYNYVPGVVEVHLKWFQCFHETVQRRFVYDLSEELEVDKRGFTSTCDLNRVVAMDFKLWHIYSMKLEASARQCQLPISRINKTT